MSAHILVAAGHGGRAAKIYVPANWVQDLLTKGRTGSVLRDRDQRLVIRHDGARCLGVKIVTEAACPVV
eukprot:904611-Lingulodinium_polyedra.AAC.1